MLAAAKDSLSDCVATIVVIACQILHYVMGIDLDAIISNDEERYKNNRGMHCKYCSSKDVCLRIAQN